MGEPSSHGLRPSSSRASVSSACSGSATICFASLFASFLRQSLGRVDQRQLLRFRLRILLQLVALEADLVLEELALRAHGHVFAGGHRERAGGECPRRPRRARARGSDARARDAEDQARVGDQAVVDAEHRGAQVAAAAEVAMAVLERRRRRSAVRVAGSPPSERAVDRHAAHLHRGQHALHAPRAEPARRAARRAACASRARKGGGRRMAARGELRAPDGRLRLGLAGEPLEQLGARPCPTPLRRTRGRGRRSAAPRVQLRSGFMTGPAVERGAQRLDARAIRRRGR